MKGDNMKSARLMKIGDLRVQELDIPKPHGRELLMKVHSCGICGSDIPRIFELGTSKQRYPLTIGHEFSGEIIAVGETANPELLGARGAVFPLIPCRKCTSCESGNYCMCYDYDYLGSRRDGGFSEYCVIPSDWHLIQAENEKTSYDALAMVEPATVAQHAVRAGRVTAGQNVVIFGAGPIGIMAARWCRIFGAAKVLVLDVIDEKVKFAMAHGVDAINCLGDDAIQRILDYNGGKLWDVVLEGTGTGAALNQAVLCTKPHGVVVMIGNPHRDNVLHMESHSLILRREITLRGIWNSNYSNTPINEWKYTVDMMDQGKLIVVDLITHNVSLDELPDLCEAIYKREVSICKALCKIV